MMGKCGIAAAIFTAACMAAPVAAGEPSTAPAPDLLWQYPRKVIANMHLGTTTYLFNKAYHKNVLTVESGYADRRIGVVCQLSVSGASVDGETFKSTPTVRQDCAQRAIPEIWKEPAPKTLQSQSRMVTQAGYHDAPTMRAMEMTRSFQLNGVQDSELRRWDFKKGEACLTREVGTYVAAPVGETNNLISKSERLYRIDAGCYPLRGNAAINFMRRYRIGEPS